VAAYAETPAAIATTPGTIAGSFGGELEAHA
jgi:hypothetical protein